MGKRWTEQQRLALLNHLGVAGLAKLRRAVGGGRSDPAIRREALRFLKTTSITRGTYSLRAVMRETGFGRTHLYRAQRALRQRWHRTRVGGQFMITQEQVDELVTWLKTDYWAVQRPLYGCLWCTTQTKRMMAHGLCVTCYYRYRRLCLSRGLPATHLELLSFARQCLELNDCGTVRDIVQRLESGLALTKRQLENLAGCK